MPDVFRQLLEHDTETVVEIVVPLICPDFLETGRAQHIPGEFFAHMVPRTPGARPLSHDRA